MSILKSQIRILYKEVRIQIDKRNTIGLQKIIQQMQLMNYLSKYQTIESMIVNQKSLLILKNKKFREAKKASDW